MSKRISSGPHKDILAPPQPELDYEKYRREMEELKTQLKTLQYTNDNHKQEEELSKLRYESELREARRKGEEDFKRRQVADAEKSKALRQNEALLKEMSEIKDATINEKAALERRVRELEESKLVLEEGIEDVKSEREENLRMLERKSAELVSRNETLQRTVEELQQDSDRREALLQEVQQQLSDKSTAYGALEAEILRLKAMTGDAETLGVIKRELSEQVTHIKKLEMFSRKQAAELDHLRQLHKSIEVVEEEKFSLQRKVERMESLENELGEARIQRQRLEDERRSWTAYLESQGDADGQFEFDSPESLARALVEERLQRAVLVERLGAVEAELSGKDATIEGLERDKSALVAQVEIAKLSATEAVNGSDTKAHLRLERQKTLAIKEVEYLKAQLSAMDDEDETFHSTEGEETKRDRVKELEALVDQYRNEVQALHAELKAQSKTTPSVESTSLKRPRDDTEENEQLGKLSRKNRKLQTELNGLQASSRVLETELSVAKNKLAAAQKQSSTRVLSLRSNPTSNFEAIKMATLATLRKENSDLLAQLQSGTRSNAVKSVPISTLEACQRDVQEAQAALASEKKHINRLKKVWGDKTTEFREVVNSLLGWDLVFMPNGKTKVTSFYRPGDNSNENSIEFDGEKGTMKVSGGPQSAFATEISQNIEYWVHQRGSVPGLLAALTMEFIEKINRDKTLTIKL
jgi:mitotic spindle assembly checkpoint protein MAD1